MGMHQFILLIFLLVTANVSASPISTTQIPEPLKPWVDWVMHDQTAPDCPYQYNSKNRNCSWPSTLSLALSSSGGTFSQQWQIFDESLIRLPGDAEHWPQNVQSQQGELLVESRGGLPHLRLKAGIHTIQGFFRWSKLPKSLKVTPESGLVALQVNNKNIERPQFNQQGQLWLTQGSTETVSEDNLDIQVFRKIIDGHPLQVVTSIKLRVSGKQRNSSLSTTMLQGFIPLNIESPLPARFESSSNQSEALQVQLRPGEWTIEVTGRALSDTTSFTLPVSKGPWPQQEVWVFASDNKIRQVEVRGANSIDPNQTPLPTNWKSLPAYLLKPAQTLTLDVLHRGASQVGQNELNLRREMWLDYDGNGYTIKDRLNGVIRQKSRLNVTPSLALGRVNIDGKDQFITRQKKSTNSSKRSDSLNKAGVEIRRESINLIAESRFTGSRSALPVSGWEHDLQNVNTTLHLPPGWRLVSASGADNLPNSWVQQWTLLDFFLMLIIMLSVAYLFHPLWAGFALITLVLTWHEPDAPRYIWLNLLAVIALLRVLPESWFKRALSIYRWISVLALFLLMLPYMIDTIRSGLYPQLENHYQPKVEFDPMARTTVGANVDMKESIVMSEPEMMNDMVASSPVQQASRVKSVPPHPKLSISMVAQSYKSKRVQSRPRSAAPKADLTAIDPNSMVQTGTGLPNWQSYQRTKLQWSGPVKADETSHLILIGPSINMLIKFLGIALLLGLSWRLVSLSESFSWNPKQWFKRRALPVLALFLLPAIFMASEPVQAESFPDRALLETLKQRLIKAPKCLPECAQIEHMQISITQNTLQARLRVHAAIDTAIPLPGSQTTWSSTEVILNEEPALAIRRDQSKQLWIVLPKGINNLVLSGALPNHNSISLPLPLKPHSVTWQSSDKQWALEGIKENGSTESQLQLNRVLSKDEKALQEQSQTTLPSLIRVVRHLNLGLDWTVDTTVTRLSPLGTTLSLNIPLLPNEQPMSEQLSIKDGEIKINLNSTQRQTRWSSRLNTTDKLILKASNKPELIETWQIATSPVWHLESSGIPVNQYRNRGQQTVPVWYPWPKETLTLTLSRPEGIAGQTITVLSSQTQVNTGKRANMVTLNLNILSSRGVQHEIILPTTATVKQITIDGVRQRIQHTNNAFSLTLKPGKQRVNVEWSESDVLSTHYRFPAVDLGLASVNANFKMELPLERWVLWVSGPSMGPAILFWGVLLSILILSIILGASKLTPLKSWQWFLLGIGLSQTETALMILVIIWLFAIAFREKLNKKLDYAQFNAMQIGLACLTVIALIVLAGAVANGLLGRPDMQIAGNGSNAYLLNWYQDRADQLLPQPSVVSVPLWIYRTLMLLWALWLAMAVLSWLRWGWHALNIGGLWMKRPPKKPSPEKTPNP